MFVVLLCQHFCFDYWDSTRWKSHTNSPLMFIILYLLHFMVLYCYNISREKFEPELGFEPRTSEFLARCSTTWAILVLMPAHVQISLLRRMPLLPGDAVMTLSVIILTTSELTSPFLHEYDIQIKLYQIIWFEIVWTDRLYPCCLSCQLGFRFAK